MEQLTYEDIEMLLDAVDGWEKTEGVMDMMVDVIGASLAQTPEAKAEYEAKRDARQEEKRSANKLRKERAVMMKAKLLSMRDAVEARSLIS